MGVRLLYVLDITLHEGEGGGGWEPRYVDALWSHPSLCIKKMNGSK